MRIACVVVPHFLVAVERRDDAALRSRPVVVGGAPEERKQVQDCSPEAIARGVHPGMSLREALSRCPEAAFVQAHRERYRAITQAMVEALLKISPLVEPAEPGVIYLQIPSTRPTRFRHPPSSFRHSRESGNPPVSAQPEDRSLVRSSVTGQTSPVASSTSPSLFTGDHMSSRFLSEPLFEMEVARMVGATAQRTSRLSVAVGIADGKFAAYAAAMQLDISNS